MWDNNDPEHDDDFATRAFGKQAGLVSEFIGFLRPNKKWWLAPIIISILRSDYWWSSVEPQLRRSFTRCSESE